MGKVFYFFKEALRGFYQAKLMTFISIVTIAVTLFFLGVLLLAYHNLRVWRDQAATQAGVSVYLADAAALDSATLSRIRTQIRALPQVNTATLIDKAEAWKRFERWYGSAMLEAVDDNPLPASLELELHRDRRTAHDLEELGGALQAIDGVEGIRIAREWIDTLERIRAWFGWGTVPLCIALLLALHFMIANTIKLTIYARRELVRNMHFVGATDSYIRMPFIIEGMLQGLAGSVLAITGLLLLRLSLLRFGLDWGPHHAIFLTVLSVGVVFGWIGSRSAVRKFIV